MILVGLCLAGSVVAHVRHRSPRRRRPALARLGWQDALLVAAIVLTVAAFTILSFRYAFSWDGFQIYASKAKRLFYEGGLTRQWFAEDFYDSRLLRVPAARGHVRGHAGPPARGIRLRPVQADLSPLLPLPRRLDVRRRPGTNVTPRRAVHGPARRPAARARHGPGRRRIVGHAAGRVRCRHCRGVPSPRLPPGRSVPHRFADGREERGHHPRDRGLGSDPLVLDLRGIPALSCAREGACRGNRRRRRVSRLEIRVPAVARLPRSDLRFDQRGQPRPRGRAAGPRRRGSVSAWLSIRRCGEFSGRSP